MTRGCKVRSMPKGLMPLQYGTLTAMLHGLLWIRLVVGFRASVCSVVSRRLVG